jgi:predicted metal-dependent phosphoesterase TrpH
MAYSGWYHARLPVDSAPKTGSVPAEALSVKIVLIDFHTHTSASDGALAPSELVNRALAGNIELLAITDHDTVSGYLSAAEYLRSRRDPLRLVSGVELSCRWSGATVHVVGLGVDASAPALQSGLGSLDRARLERAGEIARRLGRKGFVGGLEGALRHAGDSQLGRPHFAAWLVEQGHVADHNQAFDRYLGQGRIGDVKAFWPELADVTRWITASDGVAVLAHPLKYRFTRMKLRRLVKDFSAAGGEALEIVSARQTPDQVRSLCALAREFDLEASVGSDFHRDGPYSPKLGVELPRLEGLRGVWERFKGDSCPAGQDHRRSRAN